MKNILRLATVACLAVAGTVAISSPASADGCASEFVRYFSINPHDPKPQVGYSAPGTVTVNADGTVAYVQDDINDLVFFAGCLA